MLFPSTTASVFLQAIAEFFGVGCVVLASSPDRFAVITSNHPPGEENAGPTASPPVAWIDSQGSGRASAANDDALKANATRKRRQHGDRFVPRRRSITSPTRP